MDFVTIYYFNKGINTNSEFLKTQLGDKF